MHIHFPWICLQSVHIRYIKHSWYMCLTFHLWTIVYVTSLLTITLCRERQTNSRILSFSADCLLQPKFWLKQQHVWLRRHVSAPAILMIQHASNIYGTLWRSCGQQPLWLPHQHYAKLWSIVWRYVLKVKAIWSIMFKLRMYLHFSLLIIIHFP